MITYNSQNKIDKIWLDFTPNEEVGKKTRNKFVNFKLINNIPSLLTPIEPIIHTVSGNKDGEFELLRNQFPMVPAEALSIHKSQGQSYSAVCIDMSHPSKTKRMTRSMLYVALSRVTSLNGLYIIGNFKPPNRTILLLMK